MITSTLAKRWPRGRKFRPSGRSLAARLLATLAGGSIVALLGAGAATAQQASAPPMPGTTPGVATPAPDETILYYTGVDRAVYDLQLPPETSPASLGGRLIGGPTPVWTPPGVLSSTGSLAVFGRGTDNRLWWTERSASGWSPWASLGGSLTSKPTAISSANGVLGTLTVFVRGTDGAVWYTFKTPHGWSGFERLGGKLSAGTAPAAVYANDAVDLLAVGTNQALWVDGTSDGWHWDGWHSLGGRTTSDPGVTVTDRGAVSVMPVAVAFVRGTDGAGWYKEFAGSTPGVTPGWHSLGGRLTSGISASTVPGFAVHVFALGTDNQVWQASGAWPLQPGWGPVQ